MGRVVRSVNSRNGGPSRAEGPPMASLVRVQRHGPTPDSDEEFVYWTRMGTFHEIKIVAWADDPEDEALSEQVLKHHPHGTLRFTKSRFATHWRSDKEWLDKRIRSGWIKEVFPDSAAMRMRCLYCEHMEIMTESGQRAMAQHVLEAHPITETTFAEPVLAGVGAEDGDA